MRDLLRAPMPARLLALLGLTLLLASRPGRAQPTTFSSSQLRLLEAGEVLTRFWRSGDAGAGWAVGVIDASPEQVFRVVADGDRYKEFMYRMVQSRVLKRLGNAYHFYYKIDMPWPLSDYSAITRNVHELDQSRRIYRRRWTLLSGTFHRNQGSWEVRPWPGGRSLLSYSVVLLPKTSAPTALVNYGTRVALPRSVRQFRDRVAQLRRAGQL